MQTLIFDIEADNLLYSATKIWCIVGYIEETNTYHIFHTPLDNGEKVVYPKNSVIYIENTNSEGEYLYLLSSSYLVGHNIIGYDLPLLDKLYSFTYSVDPSKIADTVVMSRLSYPDRDCHSLASFGDKFKFPKGDHKDFSRFSQEMLDYCIRDIDITRRVYKYLLEEMSDWDWSASLQLEYAMQALQVKQEMHGVLFNQQAARGLVTTINKEIEEIEATVIPQIPKKLVDLGEVRKPFLKSGQLAAITLRWLDG
jgi:DNA polymerase I-like protein with 3'-5' exonuclease and polymerase domains